MSPGFDVARGRDELADLEEAMHRLHALVNWPKRHRVGCLLLLLVYLALCFIRPVTFSLTHLSARTCGILDTGDFESPISVQQQAARCLVQAHQQCQPATLQVNIHGVDRFAQSTLATANAFGGCQLTADGPSRFVILDVLNSLFPLNVLFPTGTTCHSLSLQPTGLVLQSCESRGQVYESVQVLWWVHP
jgi:hypothetical protein